jgi:hypothetical protein
VLGTWLVALAACLGAIGYVGWFTRYASDDYCTAGILLERGYLGAQAYWYSEWSGRFSFTALVSAFELLGVGVVRILPALALLAGVLAAAWALLPVARQAHWPYPRLTALAAAELVVFGTCVATPNLGQSVLWQTGILTYLLPLILACVLVGGLLRVLASRSSGLPRAWLVASVLLMWLAGGLSETTLTVQVVGLVLAALLVLVTARGRARRDGLALLAAGLVGSLLAAAVLALAPGNAERLEREAYPGGSLSRVPIAVSASFKLLYTFSRRFEGEFRPAFLACAVVPFVYAAWLATTRRPASPNPGSAAARQLGCAIATLAVGMALMLATFFPSYWVLGFDPPARILLVSQCALAATVVGCAYWTGRGVGVLLPANATRRVVAGAVASAAVLGFAVVPVAAAAQQAGEARTAAAYAADWDRNDRLLRAAGASDAEEVSVPSLPTWWGWDWVGPRTDDFPNQCVARYYGVDRVRSTS